MKIEEFSSAIEDIFSHMRNFPVLYVCPKCLVHFTSYGCISTSINFRCSSCRCNFREISLSDYWDLLEDMQKIEKKK